jgi:competence protein ComFC
MNLIKIKKLFLDICYPKFCLGCQKEGNYLCEDCKACLEITENIFCLCENPQRLSLEGKCPKCSFKRLDGLYFALSYKNKMVQKLIHQFKYEPFVKDLSENLADLIITHFKLLNKCEKDFKEKILIPVPLARKKLKNRGFNQAEEIAKELSKKLKIPIITDCLIKIKESQPQMRLSLEERRKNIKGVFEVREKEKIKNKKILLIDDVYTTGATLEEAAGILKESDAKEVFGVVVARGNKIDE